MLIPVYNVEKYLDRCIESVVGQTFGDIEIVLVDDGSSDGSLAVCERWAERDDRIRVIAKECGGVSSARNVCVSSARGKYLYFVDSDDEILPDTLSVLYGILTENDCDMVFARYIKIYLDPNDNAAGTASFTGETVFFDEDAFWNYFYSIFCDEKLHDIAVNMIVPVNKLIKASVYEGLTYDEGYIHEDELIIHKLAANCKKIAFTNTCFYNYYQNPKSIMTTKKQKDDIAFIEALGNRTIYFAEKGRSYTLKAFENFNHRFLRDYPCFCDDASLKKYMKKKYKAVYSAAKRYTREALPADRLLYHAMYLSPSVYKVCRKLLGVYDGSNKAKG